MFTLQIVWLEECQIYNPPPYTNILTNNICLFHVLYEGRLNPIYTGGGGGGGVNDPTPPPPLARNPRPASRPPQIAARLFMTFSSLTHLFIPSLRKSDHRSRWHMTFCTRTSAQNLPKTGILHYVCVQNTWKLLIFLKCTKTVFILSFAAVGPFGAEIWRGGGGGSPPPPVKTCSQKAQLK